MPVFQAFPVNYGGGNIADAMKDFDHGAKAYDNFYKDWFLLFIEEIIKEILRGNFPARRDEIPHQLVWKNTTPKGGKYSIISILRDKKALENLLGDQWIYRD